MNNQLLEPYWYTLARREIGIKEIPGPDNNSRILDYHSITHLKDTTDLLPWCSSFACWCMEQAGILSPRSARARDWSTWGVTLTIPQLGAPTLLTRGVGDQAHIGFYAGQDPTHVHILGGNQHDQVCYTKFPKVMVISYRWPTEEAMNKISCMPGDETI